MERYRERWQGVTLDPSIQTAFSEAEESFWAQKQFCWGQKEIETACRAAGLSCQIESYPREEERLLTEQDLRTWFNGDRSPWGCWIGQRLSSQDLHAIQDALKNSIAQGPVLWRWVSIFVIAQKER